MALLTESESEPVSTGESRGRVSLHFTSAKYYYRKLSSDSTQGCRVGCVRTRIIQIHAPMHDTGCQALLTLWANYA